MAHEPPRNPFVPANQKVAIPRLIAPANPNAIYPRIEAPSIPATTGSAAARTRTVRVAHACERCKARKIKCNGERPTCNHCSNAEEICRYVEKKRDTEKRRVQDLEYRVEHYERLLRDVQPHLPHSGLQLAIENALAGDADFYSRPQSSTPSSASPRPLSVSSTSAHISHRQPSMGREESDLGSEAISHISQDINTFGVNNPFGYLGKCSCVWWIQRARVELGKLHPQLVTLDTMVDPRVPSVEKLDSTMYHLDDLGMPEPNSDTSSPFTVPPKHVADLLINDYFRTVHPMFPILSESIFRTQFEHLYEQRLEPLQAGAKWLAILNLVLAIGRSHSNIMQLPVAEVGYDTEGDYFMRARILGALDGGILFQVPDLQQVQLLGLAAKYLMANHRINRAWNVISLAVVQAQGLALHLESDAPTLDKMAREIRYCVWHALYSIEAALVLITGRIPRTREVQCSTPVPGNPRHDKLDASEYKAIEPDPYFEAQRALFAIINEAVILLYNTQSSHLRPQEYQRHVEDFEIELRNWKLELPEELCFETLDDNLSEDSGGKEKRLDLGVRYHNIRMVIHRPFLCPIVETYELPATRFAEASAKVCIESARELILMVTCHDPHIMMAVGPWWSLVHFLSTAASVIMLELAFKCKHVPDDIDILFDLGDRIVNWFRTLHQLDMSSRRCYYTLEEMMRLLRLHNARNIPEGGGGYRGEYHGTPRPLGEERV